ncbi:MAG: type 4a pilus biogenesis protein PilO [Candidatus Nanopelagicales bacterium]
MSVGHAARWYIAAGVSAVLVLVAGWFLLVSPQRATAEEIRLSVDAQEQANRATEAQIATLKAQFKDLPELQKQTAAIRSKMPTTPGMASLLRQLSTLAKTSGVKLVAVTPSQPTPLVVGAAGSSAALNAPGQVNQIPVAVAVTGRFANVRLFLSGVEKMQRAMLVTGLTIARDEAADSGTSNQLKVDLTSRVFIANKGQAAPAKSTTSTAGGSSTGTAGSTSDTTAS